MKRRNTSILIVAAILLFISSSAFAYRQVIDLNPNGGTSWSFAYSINNDGQIVGTNGSGACIFDSTGHGANKSLTGEVAYGNNDTGRIVGQYNNRAYLYSQTGQGKGIDLAPLSNYGQAWAINNNNQIVGISDNHAYLFDSTGKGANINLGTLGGADSWAYSINNSGKIGGWAEYSSWSYHACLFDASGAGKNLDLKTLGGGYSVVHSINDGGQIVGEADLSSYAARACIFDPTGNGNNINLGTISGYMHSEAVDISENGQIVGDGFYYDDAGVHYHACLFDPTGRGNNIDLNTLIDPSSGWVLTNATSINDNGLIVGYGTYNGNKYRAFLLMPESKPPTANIHGPYIIYPGDILTLDASGSKDDNEIVSYLWDLDNDYNFETNAGNLPVFDVNFEYLSSLGLLPGNTYNIRLKVTDSDGQYDVNETTLTIHPISVVSVSIDIKPGTCPNRFYQDSNDPLTVAVLGTSQFDVTSINPNSIRLAGVEPLQINYQDVAAPVSDSNNCNCTTAGPDGYLDLMLEFDSKKVSEAIGNVIKGDDLLIKLTGFLFKSNGFEIPIKGSDCMRIVGESGIYSGGTGTANDPFRIGTVADWNELMNTSSDWDAYFIMTADINLQGVPLTPVGGLSLGNNYMPSFKGIFDGNGYVIYNASINFPGYWHIGLFGVIAPNSQIKNLGVEDANMVCERDMGGLVGLSEGNIINCYATGKMGQSFYGTNCGGLVGLNRGLITGCHADCDINNAGDSGGLVGRNEGGTIIDSYANGTVNGGSYAGGLVGWNMGTIIDSYAYGEVYGIDYIGGLVGKNSSTYNDLSGTLYTGKIARCYAAGSVSGYNTVGGLVGRHARDSGGIFPSITDCYSTSTVTGRFGVGGLVGSNSSGVTNCYAAGKVTATQKVSPNTPPPGGGLISGNASSFTFQAVKNCFWDINTTDQNTSGGGIGKTTTEMMTLSTFTSAGWDFVGESANGPNDVWFIREGKDSPRLAWENNKPIADTGPNQIAYAWIDGIAEVTLDAKNSYDADGDTLTYLWKWSIDGNTYESNDADLTLDLPVGQYIFELVVNDGLMKSEPNHVMVTVAAPIKSTLWVTPQIVDSGLFGQKNFMAILQLPAGISKNLVDANKKLICYPGDIKASRQFVISSFGCNRSEKVAIWAYFDSTLLVNAVNRTGWVGITVVGQLKTGQYFYCSQKVWVVKPLLKPVWFFPGYGWGWCCDRK